ncbi:hypothetical protein BP00DRAFT_444230 [Aspergillus indologenus CBS 114.80]|uniref:Tat pathway signal sequence n=1 Tax=Aspergillus indologenus CBS 114.80 TaxID=1450541 RepID=A0A2V5ICQ0_9EURO|nr:hypothetical protein BP00DRAFT_444230 [Aspergillus indologenus CBS 114.80]
MTLSPEYGLIGEHDAVQTKGRLGTNTRRTLYISSLVIVLFLAGFAAGRYQSPPSIPLATTPYVFEYNSTFQDEQSPLTNEVWEGLFPKRKGFFEHPTLTSHRSALAVFHQLHCLNGIRQGYWALYDLAARGQNLTSDEGLPHMASPHHVRHCIELLRLALMCQPDLTIELKNETLGGVTGFGTEHQCKRWEDLTGWVTRWESYGLAPI